MLEKKNCEFLAIKNKEKNSVHLSFFHVLLIVGPTPESVLIILSALYF